MGEGCAHFEVLEHEQIPVWRSSNKTIPNSDWHWVSRSGVARRVRPNIFERIEDRREHVDLEHQTVDVDTHAQIARTSSTRRSDTHIPMTYRSHTRVETVDQRETEGEIEHVEHRTRALDSSTRVPRRVERTSSR